jgi:hypothetical protein
MLLLKVLLSVCFNGAPRHEGVLGEWRCSSTHSLTSALDVGEWSASRLGRFTSREIAPSTHWIGGWVGPRVVLDAVKRKIPGPRRDHKLIDQITELIKLTPRSKIYFWSQINPVYTLPLCFPEVRSNSIFHLRVGLLSCLFPSGFPTKIVYPFRIYPMCATCPTHLILLDLITPSTSGEAYNL